MSSQANSLCSLLLKEHFGDIIQNIGEYLLRFGPRPLRVIVKNTKFSLEEVKKALGVLIQHNLATFILRGKKPIAYAVESSNVQLIARHPYYIYAGKTLYGDIGELILEEFICNGQVTMSKAIQNVGDRFQNAKGSTKTVSPREVKDVFVSLVDTHFLIRCPKISETQSTSLAPTLEVDFDNINKVPEINLGVLIFGNVKVEEGEPPPTKIMKVDEQQPDKGIYWQINFPRFHQFFRDQAIVEMVANRTTEIGGEVIRALLRRAELQSAPDAETTNPISKFELLSALENIDEKTLDCYLQEIGEDSIGVLTKCDERGGGMYSINFSQGYKVLASETAASVVLERFGSKCCRIFRLLLQKQYLDQKQIEEMSMIQPRDARELTYKLKQENFIVTKEISKTPDYAPSNTFYIFYVDLNSLSRNLLKWCYHAIQNAMLRREFEIQQNKRLLEKKKRVDAIIANLQKEGADGTQIQEVEECITPPEREQLEKVKTTTNKLDSLTLQLDKTIFVLSTYLKMS